jgi:hypothetical protein
LQGGSGLVTAEDIALNDERKMHDRVNSVLHTIRKSMDSNSYRTRKSMSKIYADADDGENPIAAAFNPGRPLQKQSSTMGTFYYKPASPTPASFRNANGSGSDGGTQHSAPGKLKHDLSKSVLSQDEQVRGRTRRSPPF